MLWRHDFCGQEDQRPQTAAGFHGPGSVFRKRTLKTRTRGLVPTGSRAFTLLEVLVSLVVMGVCLTVVLQSFSVSTQLTLRSEENAEAQRVLQNFLSRENLMADVLRKGGGAGQVPDEEGWRYQVEVAPLRLAWSANAEPLEVPGMVVTKVCVERRGGRRTCLSSWYGVKP